MVFNWGIAHKTRCRGGRGDSIDSDTDSDYVPPEPVYEPGFPRPKPREEEPKEPRPAPPREEGPGAPNIFTDSPRGREREPPRKEGPGDTNVLLTLPGPE